MGYIVFRIHVTLEGAISGGKLGGGVVEGGSHIAEEEARSRRESYQRRRELLTERAMTHY